MASPASAEPSGTPTYRELAGVGSDTTQEINNALSDAITIGGTKVIGSYNATGGGTITTKASNCNFLRPNGSGAGRTALTQSLTAGNTAQGGAVAPTGCVDFARSSGNSTGNATIIGVPYAQEAVSFAVNAAGGVAREWTLAEVINIFKCGNSEILPVLPQTGSGTRSFWLTTIGVTEAQITAGTYPCLTGAGTATSRSYNQENDGRTLKDDEIMPYSMAQYNSQGTAVTSDVRGGTVLGIIGGKVPVVFNSSFPVLRSMYTFIPKAQLNDADARTTTEQVFVTQTGTFAGTALVCQQGDLLNRYGFGTIANCGTPNAS